MSKIMFRQKTPEEIEADAAAKQRRGMPAAKIEERPSAAAPPAAAPEPVEEAGFTLDGEGDAAKPKRGRKR